MATGTKFFTPEEAALEYGRGSWRRRRRTTRSRRGRGADDGASGGGGGGGGGSDALAESVTGYKGVVSEGSERRGTQVFYAMHNVNKLGDGELSHETAEEAAVAFARHQKKIEAKRGDWRAGRGGEGGWRDGRASGASGVRVEERSRSRRARRQRRGIGRGRSAGHAVAAVATVAMRWRRWRWSQSPVPPPAEEAPQGDALSSVWWYRSNGPGEDEWYDAEVLSYDASKKKKKFKVFTRRRRTPQTSRAGPGLRRCRQKQPTLTQCAQKKAAAVPKKPAAAEAEICSGCAEEGGGGYRRRSLRRRRQQNRRRTTSTGCAAEEEGGGGPGGGGQGGRMRRNADARALGR